MASPRYLIAAFVLGYIAILASCTERKPEAAVAAFYGAIAQGDMDAALTHLALAGLPAGEALTAKGKVRIIASEMHDRIRANGGLSRVDIVDRQQQDREHASVRAELRFHNGQVRSQTHRLIKQDADWKIELRR